MFARVQLVFMGAALSALPLGCASHSAIAPDALGLLSVQPATGALTPADTYLVLSKEPREGTAGSGEPMVREYDIIEGKHAGAVLVEEVRRKSPDVEAWTVTRRVKTKKEPLEEATFERREDGGIVLTGSVNHDRGVIVEMDPRPVTIPASLEPGAMHKQEMKMRLPLISRPSRLRDKGTGTMELTYVDDQAVRLGGGGERITARHTREVFTSKLGKATAVRTIDRWFAPGHGLVAERWTEEVRLFGGMPIESSVFAIRLKP